LLQDVFAMAEEPYPFGAAVGTTTKTTPPVDVPVPPDVLADPDMPMAQHPDDDNDNDIDVDLYLNTGGSYDAYEDAGLLMEPPASPMAKPN
jgi:hypothetical protein